VDSIRSLYDFAAAILLCGYRRLWTVLTALAGGVVLSLAFAILHGPLFSSQMVVRPAEGNLVPSSLRQLGAIAGGGSGLAIGNGLLPSYIKLLQSREVALQLLTGEHFELRLFAGQINPDGTWRRGLIGRAKASLFGLFGISRHERPNVSDVKEQLDALLVVNQDQISGLITVGCTARQPELCRDLLLAVHREAEYSLARARYDLALQTRDFILNHLGTTTNLDTRESMAETLADADVTIALFGLGRPVAALIIDPPTLPDEPSFPRPMLIALLGAAAGLTLGLALAARQDRYPRPMLHSAIVVQH
jgi:uncharacterized protein involved in exopolysaccharide biosynthesis